MTLLEARFYLEPTYLNFSYGYPEGINSDWITDYQLHPPDDFLSIPPTEYVSVIKAYFQSLFRSDCVNLTPSCSLAFVIALRALVRSKSDEIVLVEPTYDSYAHIVRSLQARVVSAERNADNSVSVESVSDKCTEHTKAIVLCCPENPLGNVYSRDTFEQVITLCKRRNLTLVVDNCLAEVSPFGREVPIVSALESSKGLSYLLLGDTGKLLGLQGSKFGAVVYSSNWEAPLAAAQSAYFFQYNQYDLYLLAAILSDRRFQEYVDELNRQIAANYAYLQENLSSRFKVLGVQGGCFCLIDIEELGLDDLSYTALLIERYSALVIPMAYFYTEPHVSTAAVRIALARDSEDITRLAKVLNSSAVACRPSTSVQRGLITKVPSEPRPQADGAAETFG